MTNQNDVRLEIQDCIAQLTIDRPKALNALNRSVLQQLHHHLESLMHRNDVAVVLVRGAGGKAFVAGADISEMSDLTPEDAQAFAQLGHDVFAMIAKLPMPVIAAVDGFALGGGLELALACDMIVASDRSRFGQPEVKLGLIPGFGGCVRLPRRIGKTAATHWIVSGDIFSASHAFALGLLAEIIPSEQFETRIQTLAHTIASRGPCAVRAAKRVLVESEDCDTLRSCAMEVQAFGALFATHDAREGTMAFVEKREPQFRGV